MGSQASILYWGMGALPLLVVAAVAFGEAGSFAVLCLSLAGVGLGVWLRTARYWHPLWGTAGATPKPLTDA